MIRLPTVRRAPFASAARKRCVLTTATLAALLALAGCQSVQRTGTNAVIGTLEKKSVPPALAVSDLNMGCNYATTMVPLMGTMRSFYGDPSGLESILSTSSGICADLEANAEELRYLRAQRDKRSVEAQDARTSYKRLIERTARRQLAAYENMRTSLEKKLRFKYGETCPQFRRAKGDFNQTIYLLGTLSGLQATVNDIAAEKSVGVPTDIPPKAEFAMTCLDDNKWWGAPQAIRATVWSTVPGAAEGKDVTGTFDQSMAKAEKSGVRIAHVLAAISAGVSDDKARVRTIVKRFASAPGFEPSKEYRFIDQTAAAAIQHLSDLDWTNGTGSRTPVGGLGTFWNEKTEAKNNVDTSEFLK
ncbi:MAG: hypothetical protein V4562_08175 [Pseudomonadota bacterium]